MSVEAKDREGIVSERFVDLTSILWREHLWNLHKAYRLMRILHQHLLELKGTKRGRK